MTYPQIANLIPHEAPMIWLEALTHWEPGFVRCAAEVHADTPFVQNGQLASVVTLEHMAQAVATCLGYEAFQSGEPVRIGMIIAVRSFQLHHPTITVGTALTVEARRVRGDDTISRFQSQIALDFTHRIAEATMTLYHARSPPEGF